MISTKTAYLLQQENKTNNGTELSCATLRLRLRLNYIWLKLIKFLLPPPCHLSKIYTNPHQFSFMNPSPMKLQLELTLSARKFAPYFACSCDFLLLFMQDLVFDRLKIFIDYDGTQLQKSVTKSPKGGRGTKNKFLVFP